MEILSVFSVVGKTYLLCHLLCLSNPVLSVHIVTPGALLCYTWATNEDLMKKYHCKYNTSKCFYILQ